MSDAVEPPGMLEIALAGPLLIRVRVGCLPGPPAAAGELRARPRDLGDGPYADRDRGRPVYDAEAAARETAEQFPAPRVELFSRAVDTRLYGMKPSFFSFELIIPAV